MMSYNNKLLSFYMKEGDQMKKRYLLELLFLSIIIAFSIYFSIIYNNYWLATFNGILGLISIFLQAKGLFFAPVVVIIDSLFYGIFSLKYNYLGEFIVYIFILIPINIYGIIQWILHKNVDKTISQNKLNIKEIYFLIVISFLIIVGGFLLLKLLNSDQIILNTLSLYTLSFSNYLLSRRCFWGFIYYFLNDIILIALWATTIINGETNIISFFICTIAYLICDIYGIFVWHKIKK